MDRAGDGVLDEDVFADPIIGDHCCGFGCTNGGGGGGGDNILVIEGLGG